MHRIGHRVAEAQPQLVGEETEPIAAIERAAGRKCDQQSLGTRRVARCCLRLEIETGDALLGGAAGFSPRPTHTGAYQDGYLFAYGTRYGTALGDFRELTGPAPLLPEKAFGMWFSRYQGYSEDDYRRLLARFRAKKIPLDVLVVDTDWKAPHNWNGWQWTPPYFPDPQRFVDWAHSKGLEVILNVHPSLLPAFPGLDAQRQALAYGVKVTGCTVHLVTEELDGGPIVLQAAVPVLPDDTSESLAARILVEEHRLYPAAIARVLAGGWRIEGRRFVSTAPAVPH